MDIIKYLDSKKKKAVEYGKRFPDKLSKAEDSSAIFGFIVQSALINCGEIDLCYIAYHLEKHCYVDTHTLVDMIKLVSKHFDATVKLDSYFIDTPYFTHAKLIYEMYFQQADEHSSYLN